MTSLEGIGSFLKENGMKAVNTAVDAANIAKLTADIKAEQLKMYDIYKEIGKLYVEKAQGEVEEEFIPLFQKIADAKAKIAKLNADKDALKENIKNPSTEAAEEKTEEAPAETAEAETAEAETAEAETEAVEAEAEAVEAEAETAEAEAETAEVEAETAEAEVKAEEAETADVKEDNDEIFAE